MLGRLPMACSGCELVAIYYRGLELRVYIRAPSWYQGPTADWELNRIQTP
ncbi:hypothetical protein TIFTF001_006500 [Ficus carica]|uniref:Uncharacterized protein n=1 Tax=Ficus carica TaxID=3494 RepID=A0AA88ABE3_FICCA|nr:hypothetical protein TIFTF001_006500 [Ficus carica]